MFAGVGGFRVGLERANEEKNREFFHVVWANQYEPSTKRQHAFEVYEACSKWQNNGIHSNKDINDVDFDAVPEMDLLVGGFPCQDYSVATTLRQAAGLVGKKGVLWWQIHKMLRIKRPPFALFENVDRLLKSPAEQRGRDFAVMLASLADLDYVAEWRVINAAEYGMPQRRRRVFILAYRKDTIVAQRLSAKQDDWLLKSGVIAKAFPVENPSQEAPSLFPESKFTIKGSLQEVTNTFNVKNPSVSKFANTGLITGREVLTVKTVPHYNGPVITLKKVLLPDEQVEKSFIIPDAEVPVWKYLKGAKSLQRTKKNGIVYSYDEGPIPFPDPVDRAARTIITGEGGPSPSRFKHLVQMGDGRYRRLMPVELERLNMFPDNHTRLEGISDVKRAFFMGNALVTGIITKLGLSLMEALEVK